MLLIVISVTLNYEAPLSLKIQQKPKKTYHIVKCCTMQKLKLFQFIFILGLDS